MARTFNGSSDQINSASSTLTPPCSVSIWINPTSFANAYNATFQHSTAGSAGLTLYIKSTGKFAYYVNFGGGTTDVDPGTATQVAGVWTHVAATYDNVNGLKTYINGVSDGTAGTAGSAGEAAVNAFGYDPNNPNRQFTGSMADCAIWSVVLTASEVLALSLGARPISIRSASLSNWWPFTGLQSPEPDLSGNKNNGTLTGTTPGFNPPFMQFTPRSRIIMPAVAAAGQSFQPAWAIRNRIVVDGIGI